MEPEICTQMLKKLSEKLRAKFPATTCGYSMVKLPVSMMLCQNFFTLRKPRRRSIAAAKRKEKEEKERREKIEKLKSLKTYQVTFSKFLFLRMPERWWKERHAVILQMPF